MFIRLSSVQPSVPVVVKRNIYQQVDLKHVEESAGAENDALQLYNNENSLVKEAGEVDLDSVVASAYL